MRKMQGIGRTAFLIGFSRLAQLEDQHKQVSRVLPGSEPASFSKKKQVEMKVFWIQGWQIEIVGDEA